MSNEKIAALRGVVKSTPSRSAYHLYAFLRGRPLARLEARVSEHNLPSLFHASRLWTSLFGEPAPADLGAWMVVPEARIKRFGPRTPRLRASRKGAALLAAGILAATLTVTAPADPAPPRNEACLEALAAGDARHVELACEVRDVVAELGGAGE